MKQAKSAKMLFAVDEIQCSAEAAEGIMIDGLTCNRVSNLGHYRLYRLLTTHDLEEILMWMMPQLTTWKMKKLSMTMPFVMQMMGRMMDAL